jgi:hypothetical protein
MSRPLLALALLLASTQAAAEALRVDVLVFVHPYYVGETGSAPRHPDHPRALALDDLQGLQRVGITLLPEQPAALEDEWRRLTTIPRYQPLLRLSWVQTDVPLRDGPALRLFQPTGDGIGGLDGWLRLHAGRLPQLAADLEFVQAQPHTEEPMAWRLREQRRMATGTLQYFASTRIGLLARITPVP